jgi:hypothetical protein
LRNRSDGQGEDADVNCKEERVVDWFHSELGILTNLRAIISERMIVEGEFA